MAVTEQLLRLELSEYESLNESILIYSENLKPKLKGKPKGDWGRSDPLILPPILPPISILSAIKLTIQMEVSFDQYIRNFRMFYNQLIKGHPK